MNDISFSSADTQGWNNAAGNTPVSSGNYNMQQIPTYSEYLGLPFKLEAGTISNQAISIANQHQYSNGTITPTITPQYNTHHNQIYYNNVQNFIQPPVSTNGGIVSSPQVGAVVNGVLKTTQNQMMMIPELPTIKQEPTLNAVTVQQPITTENLFMYDKDKKVTKYKCDICDKHFAKKPTLKLHMRTHTGERPYHCQVCGKSFTQKQSVKIHMRIHTGEKPFKCITCDYTARTKGNLDNHMRKHTGERPFICKICSKSYTQKSSLNTHIKTVHSDNMLGPQKKDNKERPYQCSICNKRYTQKSSLNTHMKSAHNSHPIDNLLPITTQNNHTSDEDMSSPTSQNSGQNQSVHPQLYRPHEQINSSYTNVSSNHSSGGSEKSSSSTNSNHSPTQNQSNDCNVSSAGSGNGQMIERSKMGINASLTNTPSSGGPGDLMLTPQSSCSSSYPSPPEPPVIQTPERINPFQMTPILHSL